MKRTSSVKTSQDGVGAVPFMGCPFKIGKDVVGFIPVDMVANFPGVGLPSERGENEPVNRNLLVKASVISHVCDDVPRTVSYLGEHFAFVGAVVRARDPYLARLRCFVSAEVGDSAPHINMLAHQVGDN